MANLILQYIDGAPIQGNEDKLTFELTRWLTTLSDTLNTTIQEVQDAINAVSLYGLTAPSFTTAQITALAVSAPNGTMWYSIDHVPPVLVGKINGALVQLNTSPFP